MNINLIKNINDLINVLENSNIKYKLKEEIMFNKKVYYINLNTGFIYKIKIVVYEDYKSNFIINNKSFNFKDIIELLSLLKI